MYQAICPHTPLLIWRIVALNRVGNLCGSFLALTCQTVCQLVSMVFPGLCISGNTATVQQQTRTGSALGCRQWVMLPPGQCSSLSSAAQGMLGVSRVLQCCGWTAIPSCSRRDLGLGLACFRSPWLYLIVTAVCCSDLSVHQWSQAAGLYTRSWDAAACQILSFESCCRASKPEYWLSDHMARGLSLFSHK